MYNLYCSAVGLFEPLGRAPSSGWSCVAYADDEPVLGRRDARPSSPRSLSLAKPSRGIMIKYALRILLTVAAIAAPATALAQPVVQARCMVDSLDATAALQRIEWARRCGLLTNTGGPNSWFASSMALDMTFNPAREYREINPNRAYSGSNNDYNVNYSYAFCRYQSSSLFTVFQETAGPTTGFWKWSASQQRPRPMYPTFETSPVAGGGIQLFPLPTLPNDCNLYQRNPTTGVFTRWTGNFYVIAYCVPG